MVMRRFRRNRPAAGGAVVLVVLAVVSAAAPFLATHRPDAVDPLNMLQGPSAVHWMGTDDIGRDTYSRLLYAGRVSLALGAGVAVLAVGIGATLGAVTGYFGGRTDAIVGAVIDALLTLPAIVLAMVSGAFLQLNTWRLVVILSLVSWTTVARLVRAQVLTLRAWPFVEEARAMGAAESRILFRYVLPNALVPVYVSGTLLVAYAILVESALSFLGFGVPPPAATWGGMLNAAQLYYREAPWLAIFPGLAITLVVASINFVGEGLREALDPRLRGK
ncbi:MAG: ABC transporter permease [Armatimonadetes bacterium]|nr:ABC transporter permease [Armatimonadota bacterium]